MVDGAAKEPGRQAPLATSLVLVDAQVLDECGEYVGELLVWVQDGAILAELKYTWATDVMPTVLPPVERIRLTCRCTQLRPQLRTDE